VDEVGGGGRALLSSSPMGYCGPGSVSEGSREEGPGLRPSSRLVHGLLGMIQRLMMRRSRCGKPSPGRMPRTSHPVARRKLSREERDEARLSKVVFLTATYVDGECYIRDKLALQTAPDNYAL